MLMTEHHHFARDKNGRVSEDVCQSIKEGEKFTERRENTYDSKGHLIGTKCYRDGKLGERDVYTYDEHGLLSGERYVGDPERLISSYQSPRTSDSDVAGAPRTREEVEKDESGNAIRRRTYDTDEVLIADAYFRYNEKNIVMQSTIFHSTATGISPFKETSTTDPKSNSETIETVDRAGDILSRIVNTKSTYTIDNREYGYGGKLVKRSVEVMKPEERFTEHTETDADGKVTNYGKNWMEDGKMHTLESGNLMDGKFMTRRIDYLDLDMDLPLEIEESDASGKCLIHIRLAYDMDERGNWTKITRYDAKGDGKLEPVAVAFRTIEYAR